MENPQANYIIDDEFEDSDGGFFDNCLICYLKNEITDTKHMTGRPLCGKCMEKTISKQLPNEDLNSEIISAHKHNSSSTIKCSSCEKNAVEYYLVTCHKH